MEMGRRDADDVKRDAVDAKNAVPGVGLAGVGLLPEVVGEYGYETVAGLRVVGGLDRRADGGFDLEHGEEVADVRSLRAIRH